MLMLLAPPVSLALLGLLRGRDCVLYSFPYSNWGLAIVWTAAQPKLDTIYMIFRRTVARTVRKAVS
jgi:hypothetical protein